MDQLWAIFSAEPEGSKDTQPKDSKEPASAQQIDDSKNEGIENGEETEGKKAKKKKRSKNVLPVCNGYPSSNGVGEEHAANGEVEEEDMDCEGGVGMAKSKKKAEHPEAEMDGGVAKTAKSKKKKAKHEHQDTVHTGEDFAPCDPEAEVNCDLVNGGDVSGNSVKTKKKKAKHKHQEMDVREGVAASDPDVNTSEKGRKRKRRDANKTAEEENPKSKKSQKLSAKEEGICSLHKHTKKHKIKQ